MSNGTVLKLNGVKLTGGMQLLNYDTFNPPVYFNYILDETDNNIITEDQQDTFITEN